MFSSIGFPFLMGVCLVGSGAERTLTVLKGQPFYTALLTVFYGACAWYNIKYVVEQQVLEYVSFTLGATLVCALIAYREKLKLKNKEENE